MKIHNDKVGFRKIKLSFNPSRKCTKSFDRFASDAPSSRKNTQFSLQYKKITNQLNNFMGKTKKSFKQKRNKTSLKDINFLISQQRKKIPTECNEKMDILGQHSFRSQRRANILNPKKQQLVVLLEMEKKMKVNRSFNHIPSLIFHFENFFRIRSYTEDFQANCENIIKSAKKYILNLNNADVSRLDELLVQNLEKKKLRKFLTLQRFFVISIVDNCVRQRYASLIKEYNVLWDMFVGIYYYIFSYMQEEEAFFQHKEAVKNVRTMLDSLQYHERKQLGSTAKIIEKKTRQLFRGNPFMQQSFDRIIQQLNHQFTLNRCFYELLLSYARNLHQFPNILERNSKLLESFSSCPSPYLPFTRTRASFSLVINFQGTLINVTKSSYMVRPYAQYLLETLHPFYQIIIFCNQVQQQAEKYLRGFQQYADYTLYKHHQVSMKNIFIKDFNRLGRPLESIIALDLPSQGRSLFYQENTILIKKWKNDAKDQILLDITRYLLQMQSKHIDDIRNNVNENVLKNIEY